ncbi:hypothetical protein LG325_11955 [Marinobacter nauticus]
MSRWIDTFENHPFQAAWERIIEISDELVVDDDTVVTDVEEIARFKKVVTFLNEMISSCDPELMPESTWKNFHSQANACLQHLEHYQNNRNIGHITNANSSLDNLLAYIRPYQVVVDKAAKSASAAFASYSKTIGSSLSSFHEEARSLLAEINSLKEAAVINEEELNEVNSRIRNLEGDYFDDSESKSLSTRISDFEADLERTYEKINSFRSELFDGDSTSEPISAEIRAALELAESESKSIEELLKEVEVKVNDFKRYYVDVFGKKNDEGDFEGGLKEEIEARKKQLDSFKEKQEVRYKAINEEIEGLLPGATSAGLATAYFDLKESFNRPIENYTRLFYASIGCLVIISLISITQEISLSGVKFIDVSDFSKLASNILYKMPIVLPILWLAVFSSKRRSEALRLQQEYSHKEALAKSYQNFKIQIEALNEPSEDLMKKLLEAAIEAVSTNASETLDKKNEEKTPVNMGIDELTGNIEKLKKLFS